MSYDIEHTVVYQKTTDFSAELGHDISELMPKETITISSNDCDASLQITRQTGSGVNILQLEPDMIAAIVEWKQRVAREQLVKRVGKAIGCIDADRCNGRRESGTCDDCIATAQRAVDEVHREPRTIYGVQTGRWLWR